MCRIAGQKINGMKCFKYTLIEVFQVRDKCLDVISILPLSAQSSINIIADQRFHLCLIEITISKLGLKQMTCQGKVCGPHMGAMRWTWHSIAVTAFWMFNGDNICQSE